MITFTVNLNVPALSDESVWFANAQAWSNYWNSADVATISLDPIVTTQYVPLAFADGGPVQFLIDGTTYYLVQDSSFQSLVAKVAALDSIVQNMRQQMKDAGLITEAQ